VSSKPRWIDTHCHLQMIEESDAGIVAMAAEEGVDAMVCVGVDLGTSSVALDAARTFEGVFATVGLHPNAASGLDEQWDRLVDLAADPEVVAVGECGLDHYRNGAPRDMQEAAFRAQIRLAKASGLALVIHTRDAWADTLRILGDEGPPDKFVFHCFSGGPEEALTCLDMGAVLSMAGPIGYPKNEPLREAARLAPLDRLVVETDAPFLSPQRFRGKTNYPARVALVGEDLAAALGVPAEEVAAATSDTARRLFGLP